MEKKNFTLIELLVVIGIIAVLAGLIIPATGMARTSAKRAACISNQGQVAKLVQQGMRKNDDFLVSGNSFLQNNAQSAWDRFLFDRNVLQDLKVARCPSIVYTQRADLSGASDSSTAASDVSRRLQEAYGMVYTTVADGTRYGFDMRGTRYYQSRYESITDTSRSTSAEFQVAPNQLILGGCSASLVSDQIVARAIFSLDKNNTDTDTDIGRPVMVHGDQCNFFFADGHAESLTKENVLTKFFPSRASSGTNPEEALYVAKTYHAQTGSNSWWFDPDQD